MNARIRQPLDPASRLPGDDVTRPSHGLSQAELDRLSVSEYAQVTGDYGPFDAVVEQFIRDENTKVGKVVRMLTDPRCGRCDHLRSHHPAWPGPCSFPLCSCPGPEKR